MPRTGNTNESWATVSGLGVAGALDGTGSGEGVALADGEPTAPVEPVGLVAGAARSAGTPEQAPAANAADRAATSAPARVLNRHVPDTVATLPPSAPDRRIGRGAAAAALPVRVPSRKIHHLVPRAAGTVAAVRGHAHE